MPKTLTLTIAAGATTETVLESVGQIAGVSVVKLINPDAKSAVGRSMAFVRVTETAEIDEVRRLIREVEGVKSCNEQPDRFIL